MSLAAVSKVSFPLPANIVDQNTNLRIICYDGLQRPLKHCRPSINASSSGLGGILDGRQTVKLEFTSDKDLSFFRLEGEDNWKELGQSIAENAFLLLVRSNDVIAIQSDTATVTFRVQYFDDKHIKLLVRKATLPEQ